MPEDQYCKNGKQKAVLDWLHLEHDILLCHEEFDFASGALLTRMS